VQAGVPGDAHQVVSSQDHSSVLRLRSSSDSRSSAVWSSNEPSLRGDVLSLVVELGVEHLDLTGLYPKELGLLAGDFLLVGDPALNRGDFIGLLPECLARVQAVT
jgi:hypothetical protein